MTDKWTDDGRTEKNVALAHPYHERGVGGSDVANLVEFRRDSGQMNGRRTRGKICCYRTPLQ